MDKRSELSTVDELIEAAAELDEHTAALVDRLARITARAGGQHGVEVKVNLDGRLVGLELTDAALRLGAGPLAAEIYRLTQQASGSALAQGLATLAPIAGAELAELIGLPADIDPASVVADIDLDEARTAIPVQEHW